MSLRNGTVPPFRSLAKIFSSQFFHNFSAIFPLGNFFLLFDNRRMLMDTDEVKMDTDEVKMETKQLIIQKLLVWLSDTEISSTVKSAQQKTGKHR
jgi:hypothetical protein